MSNHHHANEKITTLRLHVVNPNHYSQKRLAVEEDIAIDSTQIINRGWSDKVKVEVVRLSDEEKVEVI